MNTNIRNLMGITTHSIRFSVAILAVFAVMLAGTTYAASAAVSISGINTCSSAAVSAGCSVMDAGQIVKLTYTDSNFGSSKYYTFNFSAQNQSSNSLEYTENSMDCNSNSYATIPFPYNNQTFPASSSHSPYTLIMTSTGYSGISGTTCSGYVTGSIIGTYLLVDPALSTPTISASTSAVYVNNNAQLTVGWSNGVPGYTVKLTSGSSATNCTSDNSTVNSLTTNSNSATFSETEAGAGNVYYCATINDSSVAGSEKITTSTPVEVSVANPPTLTISPSNTILDAKQYETYTLGVTGGFGPFNIALYNTTTNKQQGNNVTIQSPGGTAQVTFVVSNPGQSNNISFNAVATDKGVHTPDTYVFNSITSQISVYPTPTAMNLTPSNTVLDAGQYVTYNVLISNGKGPFTVTLHGPGGYAQRLTGEGRGVVTFTPFIPSNGEYYVTAIDSGVQPNFDFNSTSNTIEVYSSPSVRLTPSSSVLDQGQTNIYTLNMAGGSGNFVARMLYDGQLISGNVNVNYAPGTSGSTTIQYTPPATGAYAINVVVTDVGITTPIVFNSTNSKLIVNYKPQISTFTAVNTSLDIGQIMTYDIGVVNGTGPFTANLYDSGSAAPFSSGTYLQASGSSNVISVKPNVARTYDIYANVTDLGTSISYVITKSAAPVTVYHAPTVSISPSNSILNEGQYEIYSVTINGGSAGPYTVSLIDTANHVVAHTLNAPSSGTYTFNLGNTLTAGEYTYNAVAVDNGVSVPFTFASVSNTITVVGGLSVTAPQPNITVMDYGHLVSYNAILTPGVGPFVANLVIDGNVVATQNIVASGGAIAFNSVKPQVGTDTAFIEATDLGTSTRNTYTSGSNTIIVYPPLTASLVPSNTVLDYGQSETYKVITTGGSGDLSAALFNMANGVQVGSMEHGTGTMAFGSFVPSNIVINSFNAVVTDLGVSSPEVVSTATNSVDVYPVPTLTSLTPDGTIFDHGQEVVYSVVIGGGSPHGAYKLTLVSDNGTVSNAITNSFTSTGIATFGAVVPAVGNSQASNTETFRVIGTDMGTTTPFAIASSASNIIIVRPTPIVTLSMANVIVDIGQTNRYMINVTRGVGPFNGLLVDGQQKLTANTTLSYTAGSTATGVYMQYAPSSSGFYPISVLLTDMGTSIPYVFNSINYALSVNYKPKVRAFAAINTSLDIGQLITYNIVLENGTGPFGAALYNYTNGKPISQLFTIGKNSSGVLHFAPTEQGTYNLYANVIEEGTSNTATQETLITAPINVIAYPTPTVAITPSNSVLDYPQNVTYSAVITGGSPEGLYTATLYDYGGSVIERASRVGPGALSFNSFTPPVGQADTYNAVVVDNGVTTPFTFNSVSNTIETNPTPTVTITPSNTILDHPQSVTYTVNVANGEGPFNVALYNTVTNAEVVSNKSIGTEDSNGGTGTFTFIPPVGSGSNFVDSYNVVVTDQGTINTAFVFNSITNTISDYPTPYATISPINTVLDYPQMETYTINAYNGVGPFTAELVNSSGRAAGTANVTVQEGGSNTITFKPSVGTGKSPNSLDSYWVILTDKGTVNTPFVFNSNTNTIVDNPTPVVTELITSNEVLDQGQFDTISTQPNGGTGPFTVYFKNATNGDVLRTVANVPLDAEVNYTFPVNDLVSNSSGPTFAMIGVVANMVDQGTSVPFIFQSENSSANTTQLNKLTVSAPSEYASYICAGGSGNANVSVLWTPDANDSADSGLPYSSVGRQHSNSCTIYTKSPSLSEVALGINNTNFKLYTSNSMTKVLNQTLNYSVSVNGSTTLIVAACGLSRCTSISPPDRCDTRLILTGKDAHETAYVALCKNQTAGSYNVRANMSGLGGTSIAAYVFANGVQVSNVTGKNITFAVYTRPFTTLTTYALNGTQTDKLMYGKGGFSANAVVTPGAGPFSFAWTLNGANAYNVTINGTDTSNTITGFGGIVAGGNYTYNVSIVDLGTTTHFVLPKVSATFTVEKNNSLNATVVNPKVVSFSNLTTLTFTGMPTIFNQSRWELYVNGTLYGTTNSVITWSEQNQVGVHSFEFVNPGNNNYTAYHVNTTLTVNPPTPTGLITGGGGGGGGGVGGGGSFKPTVLTQSTSNLVCSTILNFTQHNEETLVVLNKTFQVTENYITPTTAGITVGSNTYEMSLNQSQLVGSYNGINYTIKLVKLSYLPIIDTVDIAVCGTVPTSKVAPITAPKNNTAVVVTNVTTQSQAVSGAYNLSKNQSVHFKVNGLDVNVKVTSSSSTKTLHDISISKYNKTAYLAGHSLLGALNISIKPGQNTTVTVTEGYACNADIQSVQPYVLLNGQWTLIKNFSVDAAACQVTFTVLGDPIVALFATEAAPKPASTTQTVSSSSGSAPTSSSPMAVIVVIALAAVAIITAYAYRQMGREGRESKKRKPA